MHQKTCSQCSEKKKLHEFYFRCEKHVAACKECYRKKEKEKLQDREYRERKNARRRASWHKNKYPSHVINNIPVECTICHSTMRLAQYQDHISRAIHLNNLKGYIPPTEKPCSKCNVTKPMTEFYVYVQKKDGRRSTCKECECKPKKASLPRSHCTKHTNNSSTLKIQVQPKQPAVQVKSGRFLWSGLIDY